MKPRSSGQMLIALQALISTGAHSCCSCLLSVCWLVKNVAAAGACSPALCAAECRTALSARQHQRACSVQLWFLAQPACPGDARLVVLERCASSEQGHPPRLHRGTAGNLASLQSVLQAARLFVHKLVGLVARLQLPACRHGRTKKQS